MDLLVNMRGLGHLLLIVKSVLIHLRSYIFFSWKNSCVDLNFAWNLSKGHSVNCNHMLVGDSLWDTLALASFVDIGGRGCCEGASKCSRGSAGFSHFLCSSAKR